MSKYLRIKELRLERKWTRRKVAELVGVAPGHIYMLETGRRGVPLTPTLEKLAAAFGVNIRDLLA